MSLERMRRLFVNSITQRSHSSERTRNEQVIFPETKFNCSGQVVKWIVSGTWRTTRDSDEHFEEHFVEFQIWRETESGVLLLVNSSTAYLDMERRDRVYEIVANPPVSFQQHDMLGVFNSGHGNFYVGYDRLGSSEFYSLSTSELQESFDLQCLQMEDSDEEDSSSEEDSSRNSRNVLQCPSAASIVSGRPLVSVVIGKCLN